MSFLHAIILGIVEGITEFLPISSTGHLLIANRLLGTGLSDFVKSFDIYVQLGSILAVVVLYLKKLLIDRKTFFKVVVAFIPTAAIGLVLYPLVKNVLLGNLMIVALALIIGGIVMIAFEYWYAKKSSSSEHIGYGKAASVGLFQALALIPGVSRSAATIIGGMSIGVSREAIVEFSFLLAIPTMAAATGLDMLKSGFHYSSQEWLILAVGFIASFITALLAIRFFINYIKTHDFKAFGWYRIIVGILILIFLV